MMNPKQMTYEAIRAEMEIVERYSPRWWTLFDEMVYREEQAHPLPDPQGHGVHDIHDEDVSPEAREAWYAANYPELPTPPASEY